MTARSETALTGPALRLHLVELFLPAASTPEDAVQAARAAYEFIEPPLPVDVININAGMFQGKWQSLWQGEHAHAFIPAEVEPASPATPQDAVPVPVPVPEPGSEPEPAPKAKPKSASKLKGVPNPREERFKKYAAEGWDSDAIVQAENIQEKSISAAMATFKLTATWRANQIKRLGVAPVQPRDKQADARTLEELCRAGASRKDIATALGVAPNGIHMRVAKAGLSHVWENAKLAQASKEETPAPPKRQEAKPPVKVEEPITAKRVDQVIDKLNKPVLPEDRLRRIDDPAACPCDIETVESWLEGQGLKLTFEGDGVYTCEGTPMTAAQLVKRANKARKAVSLPAFDVRGI